LSIEHQELGDGAGQRERKASGVSALQALRAKRDAAIHQGIHNVDGLGGVPSGVKLADTGGDAKAQDKLSAIFLKYSSKQPRAALEEGRFRVLANAPGASSPDGRAKYAETPGKQEPDDLEKDQELE
jgi:hypothetical protein